jgi:hypothetical protein
MDLKTKLENRIARLKREITSKKGALERAQVDLENLAHTEARLSKQREKKNKKASAPIRTPKEKPAPEAKLSDDKIEIPTVEMDLPAPPAPAPEKKKSKLTFF